MDRLIEQYLEEYLAGTLDPRKREDLERRLEVSDDYTRRTVSEFQRHSQLIRTALRAPEDVEPAAGFYARVLRRIEAQRTSTWWWSAFLEPQFSRRLALATVTLLVLLGITMWTTETEEVRVASSPVEVMAEPSNDVFGADQAQDRDIILVDLATFQE